MVSQTDYDQINVLSQFDHDSTKRLTPGEALIAILKHHEEIIHGIDKNQIDIDMHINDNGTATLTDQVRIPMMITDVIVSWQIPTVASSEAAGQVTSPAAQAVIANLGTLPQGTYTINYTNALSGTTGAGDINNFGLYVGANLVGTLTTGANSINITVPSGGAVVQIRAIALGTVGAVYDSTLAAVEQMTSVTITIDDRTFYGTPNTGLFTLQSVHGMQVGIHKKYQVVTSPAVPVHFSILGYADQRKVDRL